MSVESQSKPSTIVTDIREQDIHSILSLGIAQSLKHARCEEKRNIGMDFSLLMRLSVLHFEEGITF
jgi:hypothetical protein